MNNEKMMWAYLIQLGDNMWGCGNDIENPKMNSELLVDYHVWRRIIDFLPLQGINTLLIDVGDAIQYERHPEISIKGAWSKDKMKKELDYIRSLGLTPIPKLNFSAGHDQWLGIYNRMLSTPKYYEVCRDVITEVAELFDYPEYFHLGMDEETARNQRNYFMIRIRQKDLLWHDMYFLFDVCEKLGCRPWIWSDMCWNDDFLDSFLKKMPKSVLQSNWHYWALQKKKDGTYMDREVQTYTILEEAGFDQVPTCSTIEGQEENPIWTMEAMKKDINPKRLKGYMTSPWARTTVVDQYRLMHDASRFGYAKKKVYPEEC